MRQLNINLGLLICALVFYSGCGKGAVDIGGVVQENNKTNIQKLTNTYSLYADRKARKGPASEERLKEFLRNDQSITKNLEYMGIGESDIDAMFTSDRDGQPFEVRWGVTLPPMGAPRPIIFESAGVDGKFMVGFSGNEMHEVSKDDRAKLLQGKDVPGIGSGVIDTKGSE